MSPEQFTELQEFIYRKSGMFFPFSRKSYIEQKIRKRMEHYKFHNYDDYIHIVKNEVIRTEIIHLFNEITVNETFFFRDLSQLEAMQKHILPELMAAGKRHVNILSAGCSSGEEAYTLGMILREFFPQLTFLVRGVDISEKVVAKAMRAEYTEYAVRFIPDRLRQKYFTTAGGVFHLKPEGKTGVHFGKANLMEFGDANPADRFDIVFCRYVLIYFDTESKKRVLERLRQALNDPGYLILGNSESLYSLSNDFKMLHFPSAIIYKKRGAHD